MVLCQLTENGRAVCESEHIDPGPRHRESLEHRYWVRQVARDYEKKGYEVTCEHPVKGNAAVDILASRPGEKIAIEVETGKSNIKANLEKLKEVSFDKIILLAANPSAVRKCQKAIESVEDIDAGMIEQLSWLDFS